MLQAIAEGKWEDIEEKHCVGNYVVMYLHKKFAVAIMSGSHGVPKKTVTEIALDACQHISWVEKHAQKFEQKIQELIKTAVERGSRYRNF